VEGGPKISPESEVLAGHAQFGVGSSNLVVTRIEGKPVVALGVIFQHSPLVLITPRNPTIQSTPALEPGKRIMIRGRSDELAAYLGKLHISLDALVELPHSYNPQDLIDGKVDAMSAFLTNEPDYLDRAGFSYRLYSPRAIGIDFYGDNLFTTEQEIAIHPAQVRAFRAAALRGWNYAMNNSEEIVDLILAKYSKRSTREHLLYEAHQMVPLVQPVLVELGYMNPARWRHIAETYADLNMVPHDARLDGFLYNPEPPPDRTWLIWLLIGVALFGVAGTLVHVGRISRERCAANAALRESEGQLRTLIEALPQQVWTASAEGQMDYVNYRVTEYFGQDKAELLRGGLQLMMHPDDFPEAVRLWKIAVREGTRFDGDYRLRRWDGIYRWHMGMALPLRDGDGRIVKWFGSSTDITERKEAETAQQEANEQLESRVEARTAELRQAMEQIVESQKLASLGALVAGVSHELNTPIGNIVMIASALSDRVSGLAQAVQARSLTRSELNASIEECRSAAEIIVRSAHRAGDLIESFKRVSVDQASQRRRKFDLRQTVQDILNAIGPTTRRANAQVELRIAEGITMDSFPGHLEQIISNLVMNSIKHGFDERDGGIIRILAHADADTVELVYEDNGRGIAEELQHKVFEPFYTTKLGQGGSGLGMSIVHNLTHAIFKGRVKLESTVGTGIRLTFMWPVVTPESASERADAGDF
jgi:PAS domain S-box-containing protein